MRKNNVELSIVVVNFNGRTYLEKCVKSILNSNVVDYEIIIVDNGSTDGSVKNLESKFGKEWNRIKIVQLANNYGPAKARNDGVRESVGKYLCFLDNDTEVHPNWSVNAIREFEKDDNLGIVQCKLLLAKEREKIDYVGEYIGMNGFLIQRASAGEIDSGQYDQKVNILAAKSAGMFIRKESFYKAGGFDGDYFIYVEETDLGWRVWLSGYLVRYESTSIVFHEFGTSAVILGKDKNNYNAKFHGCKNYILTLLKNLNLWNVIRIIPLHVFLWIGLAWFILFKGNWRAFYWIHKGIFWNVVNLRKNLKKRAVIQESRKINDKELFKIIMKRKPFFYFLKKATGSHKVGNAEGFIKSK